MNNEFMLDIIARLNKQLSKSAINGDLKSLNNTMYVRVLAKLSKTLATRELKKQLKELDNLKVDLEINAKIDKKTETNIKQTIQNLQKSISDLEIGLKTSKVDADIDKISRSIERKISKTPLNFNLEIKKEKAIADIEYIGKKYSKLFSNLSASQKYEKILNSAYGISDTKDLSNVRAQISAFTSELKSNGLAVQSVGDKWKTLIDRSKEFFSAASVIRLLFTQMKEAVRTTIDLDKVYTDLVKVNDQLERNDYSNYLEKCNRKAQELAATQKSLIEGAAEFSKSGYDLPTSDKLTEKSTILSNVGEMSASDSAKAIISGVQAYDTIDGYKDVVDKAQALIDKYNELGNTASITTAELAQGVQSVGSVFADANTSVDEFLALLSAGNRQYQDADALALGLRTSALRIRGCTAELEAMGEETDTVVTSASKLEEKIKGLTNVNGSGGVEILEADKETFRSIYDIYVDIGKVYKDMSDLDQSALLELIAGKNRASAISATLNNMTEAETILQNSLHAAGSAQKEYDAYLESTKAHIQQFQAKLVETYSTFVNGDMISHVADLGTAILDLVNKTDLLKHSLIAIATIKIGQSITTVGGAVAGTITQMSTLGNALQKMRNLPLDDVLREKTLKEVGEATKDLTEKNLKLLLSQKQLEENDRVIILSKHNLTEEEARAKLETMGLTTVTNANTAANTANASSAKTLKGTFTGLAASVKATWAAMSALQKASIIFAAISTVWSIGSSIMSGFATESETAKEKAEGFASSVNKINENIAGDSSKLSELNSRYQELSKGVNSLGENVSLSTSNYAEYKDIISQISGIMPGLTTYFNAQGEKIGFVKGKLEDLNKEHQKYLQQQAKDLFYNGDEEGNTVQDSIDNLDYNREYGKVESKWKSFVANIKSLFHKTPEDSVPAEIALDGLKELQNKSGKEIHDYLELKYAYADFDKLGKSSSDNTLRLTLTDMLGIYSLDDLLELDEEGLNELHLKIAAKIEEFSADIETDVSEARSNLILALQAKDGYWEKLDDKQRNSVSTLVSSFNSGLWNELKLKTPDDFSVFAQKIIDNISADGDFSDAWNQLFGDGLDKLPVNEYVAKVRSLADTIGDALELTTDEQKNSLLSGLGFDNLDELVNDYNSAIKSATEKWKLDDSQKNDLEKFFVENSINTEAEIDAWKEIASEADNATDAKRKYLSVNIVQNNASKLEQLKETYKTVSEDVTSFTTALSEAVSGKGLSTDSVDKITSIFDGFEEYDPEKLFDKTANGLRINAKELERLKKLYDDDTAKEFYMNVTDAYDSWQEALRNGEEETITTSLYNQYQQAVLLADQYVGLTSAYNQWQNALSTENEGSMYDSIYNNIESVKEMYKKGLVGTDDFRTFADLISPKDLTGATTDEVVNAYKKSIGKIKRYFTEGQKGAQNFLNDVQKVNSEWAHMNNDGSWEINFGAGGATDRDVAKKLGIDVEALQAVLRKLNDYGFDIDIGSSLDSIEMMEKSADDAYKKLKKLGKTDYKFRFDTGDIAEVNKQITKAEEVLNDFRDSNGNVDLGIKGAKEAQSVLIKLLTEKQELEKPAILKINTDDLSGKASGVFEMLQKIQQDINTYDVKVAVGADTSEAEKKINSDIKAIKSSYGTELANVHITLDNIDTARKELSTLTKDDIDLMVNAIINHEEIDKYKKKKEEKKLKVTAELDDKAVNDFMGRTLQKTIDVKLNVDDSELNAVKKSAKSGGSTKTESHSGSGKSIAHADGTFSTLKNTLELHGCANASGNISIPKNQTALVNELGEELIVRDGKWFTVKGGAQFAELKKGDIIFNHMQTKQLLKNGKITSSSNHGKMAYASGSMNNGSSSGGGRFYPSSSSSSDPDKKSSESKSTRKIKSEEKARNAERARNAKKAKKTAEEVFDWIERRIKKFQQKFDKWIKQAETAVTSGFIGRYYKKALSAAKKELSAYGKAYKRYMKQADSIGLGRKYRDKVKDGTIDIQSIRDEKLAEKIKKYQEYYDKAQESTESFVETAEKLYNLPLDKAAKKVEKFSDSIDLLDKKLDNAVGAKSKNKLIDKQTKEEKKTLDAYKKANSETKSALKSAKKELTKSKNLGKDDGITKAEKKKVKAAVKAGKEVDLSYFKVGSAGYNAAVKYNEALKANTQSAYDLKAAQEDYRSWLSEAATQKFENIRSEYENELGLLEHRMSVVDSYIKKAEALGHMVSESYYRSLMSQEQENIRELTKEREELQKSLEKALADGSIAKYSDGWYELTDAINEVTTAINDATVSAIEYQKQLRQLAWDRFDMQQDYISRIQSESEFLAGIMENRKLFDDNGSWTEYCCLAH